MPSRRPLLAIIAVLLIALPAAAQQATPAAAPQQAATADADQPATPEDVRQLQDLMGARKLAQQVMDTMISMQKDQIIKLRPDIPAEFWTELLDRLRQKVDFDGLFNSLQPVYARHFTHEDIRQLIAFYSSPVGQKFVRELPQIQMESMQIGRDWGQKIGGEVATEVKSLLEEKGYQLGTPPKAPPKNPQ